MGIEGDKALIAFNKENQTIGAVLYKLYTSLSVDFENCSAINIYNKLGFKDLGTSKTMIYNIYRNFNLKMKMYITKVNLMMYI